MGSGKTSLASALARRLGCEALDLDKEIELVHGRSPGEIISEDGETIFRKIEAELLRTVLQNEIRVIALGGGAWTIPQNRELITQFDCFTVWLDAPFDVCWARISAAGVHRPLAPEKHEAAKLYEQRMPIYSLADLRLQAGDEVGPDELARQLTSALKAPDGY